MWRTDSRESPSLAHPLSTRTEKVHRIHRRLLGGLQPRRKRRHGNCRTKTQTSCEMHRKDYRRCQHRGDTGRCFPRLLHRKIVLSSCVLQVRVKMEN